MVTEVQRHERHAGFHQPPRKQRLLTPQVAAVALPSRIRLLRNIERLPSTIAEQQVGRLLRIRIHRVHRTAQVQPAPHLIEPLQQPLPLADAVAGQAERHVKQVRPADAPGVAPHQIVDRQPRRLVGQKRIVLLPQIARERKCDRDFMNATYGGIPR